MRHLIGEVLWQAWESQMGLLENDPKFIDAVRVYMTTRLLLGLLRKLRNGDDGMYQEAKATWYILESVTSLRAMRDRVAEKNATGYEGLSDIEVILFAKHPAEALSRRMCEMLAHEGI